MTDRLLSTRIGLLPTNGTDKKVRRGLLRRAPLTRIVIGGDQKPRPELETEFGSMLARGSISK